MAMTIHRLTGSSVCTRGCFRLASLYPPSLRQIAEVALPRYLPNHSNIALENGMHFLFKSTLSVEQRVVSGIKMRVIPHRLVQVSRRWKKNAHILSTT